MTWSPTMPTVPGRYFYRDASDGEYGICLVAWSRGFAHHGSVYQPELKVTATCNFGSRNFGENSDYPNWSYGGTREAMEFWSEPLVTPGFPDINGRPADIAPEVIKKEKAKGAAQTKAHKKREREQAKARKAAIKAAFNASEPDEATLYECDGCNTLVLSKDLVTGKLRECPHCSTEFVESDAGRNCPDCNRPFTRLVEEKQTCADCRDGGDLPDLKLIVKKGVTQ